MGLYIAKGDIFEQHADVFVIPSQPSLRLEGSIGGKLKEKCGNKLIRELSQLKNLSISNCAITNAYNLNCKKLIFCATPMWKGGKNNEDKYLYSCYKNALELANSFGLNSIAFPLLSTGAYKYPNRDAIEIAIKAIEDFLNGNELAVGLVIYDKDTYKNYKDIFEYYEKGNGKLCKKDKYKIEILNEEIRGFNWYKNDTAQNLDGDIRKKSFGNKLKEYLSLKGKSDSDCYLNVVSKTMFYKYLSGESIPNKYTIVSLGINLYLKEYEINELLQCIGDRLREELEMDQIILYFIRNENYYVDDINDVLRSRNYPPLKG